MAKFEPVFADVDADSDDDVEGVTVRERKEERAEKHGEKVIIIKSWLRIVRRIVKLLSEANRMTS